MRKIFLTICFSALLSIMPAFASNDLIEDYIDISANYCVIGDYKSAIVYLDKIMELDPNNTQISDLKKGLLHILAEDKKTYVTGVNPYVKQAQEFKRIGDDKKEVETLLEGTQKDNSYLAYYYLGNYFRDNRNYLKALDYYNSAVSARADFAQSYLASAATLIEIGRFANAINPLDKYLTFLPNDDLAYALKSRAEFELGRIEEAREDNNKAIQINNCPEYQFDRAKILYKMGDFEQAKALFNGLLPDIQTAKIYEYMGLCDYAMEDYTSALMNIDKAIILSEDDRYLENKYNEIKQLIERDTNEQTSEE